MRQPADPSLARDETPDDNVRPLKPGESRVRSALGVGVYALTLRHEIDSAQDVIVWEIKDAARAVDACDASLRRALVDIVKAVGDVLDDRHWSSRRRQYRFGTAIDLWATRLHEARLRLDALLRIYTAATAPDDGVTPRRTPAPAPLATPPPAASSTLAPGR